MYPVDFIVELADKGFPDFEVFSRYDIFMMLYHSPNELIYRELIKFLLGDVNFSTFKDARTEKEYLYDVDKKLKFDEESYLIASAFIRKIHNIPEDVSKMAHKSKALKRVLIETKRQEKEAEKQNKDKSSEKSIYVLPKIIDKLAVSTQHQPDKLANMKLYRFYKIWYNTIEYKYWEYTMMGIYTGSIDAKKIKKDELNWFDV